MTRPANVSTGTAAADSLNRAVRPLQTSLTLLAFSVSAFLLEADFGAPATIRFLGWMTAALGVVSTFDLLYRRWKSRV